MATGYRRKLRHGMGGGSVCCLLLLLASVDFRWGEPIPMALGDLPWHLWFELLLCALCSDNLVDSPVSTIHFLHSHCDLWELRIPWGTNREWGHNISPTLSSQQIFIERLLGVRYYSRCRGYHSEHSVWPLMGPILNTHISYIAYSGMMVMKLLWNFQSFLAEPELFPQTFWSAPLPRFTSAGEDVRRKNKDAWTCLLIFYPSIWLLPWASGRLPSSPSSLLETALLPHPPLSPSVLHSSFSLDL